MLFGRVLRVVIFSRVEGWRPQAQVLAHQRHRAVDDQGALVPTADGASIEEEVQA